MDAGVGWGSPAVTAGMGAGLGEGVDGGQKSSRSPGISARGSVRISATVATAAAAIAVTAASDDPGGQLSRPSCVSVQRGSNGSTLLFVTDQSDNCIHVYVL